MNTYNYTYTTPPEPDANGNSKTHGERRASDVQIGGSHYKNFLIQPAKFAEDNKLSFLEGCVVKRVCRHCRGGKGAEDIRKAIHELQLLLEHQYGETL